MKMENYSKIIAESDGDLPFGSCVSADINFRKELVIEYVTTDYKTEIEQKKVAVVDNEDSLRMAEYLGVELEALPQSIFDECGDSSGVCTPSEVQGIFKDVLEYILDCGARYVLK